MTINKINDTAKYLKDNVDLITKVLVERDDPEYIGLYATKETLRIIIDIVKDSANKLEQQIGELINERGK